MKRFERQERLVALIRACGGKVEGRKKLQKLVYLAQKMGFWMDYDFGYRLYGVYCTEVETDKAFSIRSGLLAEEQSDENSFVVRLGAEVDQVQDFHDSVLERVACFACEEPRTLEVLTTILYLSDSGLEGSKLQAELDELKGHISPANHQKAWSLYRQHFQQ